MTIRERLLLWWGRRHIGETIRRRALRRELCRVFRRAVTGRFLDAGCGRGDNALWVARRWPTAYVDALDIDPALVARAERRVRDAGLQHIALHQEDIERPASSIKHAAFPYAIIYSVDVFEHLRDPASTLKHLAARLAPDGSIILHVPRLHQRRFFKRFHHYEQHDHEREGFEPADVEALAADAGLLVQRTRHTFGPPGALAWELFHIAQGMGKWCALLVYPVLWLLAWIDGCVRWRRGNGILVVLQKHP